MVALTTKQRAFAVLAAATVGLVLAVGITLGIIFGTDRTKTATVPTHGTEGLVVSEQIIIAAPSPASKPSLTPQLGSIADTTEIESRFSAATPEGGPLETGGTAESVSPTGGPLEIGGTTKTALPTGIPSEIRETTKTSVQEKGVNTDDRLESKGAKTDILSPEGKRPNILLLYSDQHQGSCTGYEGHPDVLTPHLDKIAAEGVRFSRAYVNDGVCAASRQSFMSGLYPRTLGSLDNSLHPLTTVQKEARSLAQTLGEEGGYATATFGKRHLGTIKDKGLDKGWDMKFSHRLGRDKEGTYLNWLEDLGKNPQTGNDFLDEFYVDKAACDDADLCTRTSILPSNMTMEAWTRMKTIDYIQNHDSTKPFFLWSTFYRPHQPYNPQPKFLDMYEERVSGWKDTWGDGLRNDGSIRKPSNLEQDRYDLPRGLKNARKKKSIPWNLGKAADDHQIYRDYIASYYALVTEVDEYVGDILRVLEEEGLANDTIVVYTSDHGEFAGRHGLVSKLASTHSIYEEVRDQ